MRRRFGTRRRFGGRRRHVARQYRTWDVLLQGDTANDLSNPAVTTFKLDADNSRYLDVEDAGDAAEADASQVLTQSEFGLTGITPLVDFRSFSEHGQEFTIRALHGYIWPFTLGGTDGNGTAISPETPLGNSTLCRLAIGQIEVNPDFWEQQQVIGNLTLSGGAFARMGIWRRRELRQRIWWMRDFLMTLGGGIEGNVGPQSQNGAAVWSPNLFSSAFGVHLRRFNFRVRRNLVPALFWGVSGFLPTTEGAIVAGKLNIVTVTEPFRQLGNESSISLTAQTFLRAFITR